MRLVNLVHNHPDSSGFGGFLTDFLWTLATIFFFSKFSWSPLSISIIKYQRIFFHPDPIRGQHYYIPWVIKLPYRYLIGRKTGIVLTLLTTPKMQKILLFKAQLILQLSVAVIKFNCFLHKSSLDPINKELKV